MNFEYNTQRKDLILPEYGRNIERLVEYAMTIEDREERTRCAHSIIAIMTNINPHYRDNSDFKHKLWDHLAIISNFELDVDYPYEVVKPEVLNERPQSVPYSKNNIKYKHYGRTVELLIEEAIMMDDPEKKHLLIWVTANHMKRLYLTWNNEQMIQDEQIFKDMEEISEGRLQVNREMKLTDAREIRPKRTDNNQNNQKNNRRYKNKSTKKN
jgi:hypothetical protein